MWVFVLLGLGVGVVSGVLGIGGGILLIPGLMWLLGDHDYRRAAGMTLAVLTLPVFLPSTWKYVYSGIVRTTDVPHVALVAIGVAVGAFAGAHLVEQIPVQHVPKLKLIFGLLLLYVALRTLLTFDRDATAAFFGLLAVALAWLTFLGLRLVGRRAMTRPSLTAKIQAAHEQASDPLDYSI